jgi:hypothetical protein
MSNQPSDQSSPENTAPNQDQGPQATTTPPDGNQAQINSATSNNDPTGANAAKGVLVPGGALTGASS